MSQLKWHKTGYKGIRYRLHPTRKHGKRFDVYYAIRYQEKRVRIEEGLGWVSETGMTLDKANKILADLKEAATKGEGATRLSEKRDLKRKKEESEKAEQERVEKETVTFGQYFETVYFPTAKIGRKKDTTRKGKEHFKNWISPIIGKTPLKDVKPFAIAKIKKNILAAGKTPRSLQYVFATIRQAWNMARRDGLVTGDSPTKQVKIPKVDNKRMRFLSHAEAETLLNALQARDLLTHDLALLSLHTGLRFGEIANLKWGHIDLDRGIIAVTDTKNKESRAAFMTVKVKAMFGAKERRGPDDPVFTKKDGEPLNEPPKAFPEVVKSLGFNNGVSDPRQRVFFHTLRHTFASWHVENGTDLYTVKELMGHSVIAMTERYSHLSPGTLQNATKNIEKAIDSAGQDNTGQVVNFPK